MDVRLDSATQLNDAIERNPDNLNRAQMHAVKFTTKRTATKLLKPRIPPLPQGSGQFIEIRGLQQQRVVCFR